MVKRGSFDQGDLGLGLGLGSGLGLGLAGAETNRQCDFRTK